MNMKLTYCNLYWIQ